MEAELVALDLPLLVQGFLITIGGTMSALGGSKLLQKACIMNLLLTTAGGITPIIANWDTIKPQWDQIVQAFQKAFGTNASSIASAFKDIEVKASKKSAEEKAKSNDKEYKTKKEVKGKQKDDIPERFKGEKPYKGESGKDAAKRVLEKYGEYDPKRTGPGTDFNKLKKYFDTHFA